MFTPERLLLRGVFVAVTHGKIIMRKFLQELVVPALVLLGATLYWISLTDAPAITKRIPMGVIVLVVALTVIVVIKAAVESRRQRNAHSDELLPFRELLFEWWLAWYKRLILIGLGIGYYLAFRYLGFSLANFLFLLVALTIAGFAKGSGVLAATGKIAGTALLASTVFYWLAVIMNFNVPRGPLGL